MNDKAYTRNTQVNGKLLTPCPTCGARCYALFDLDEEDKCNDCRVQPAKLPKTNIPGGYKAWKPGQSGNPNGRPKGSINRTPKQLREVMFGVIRDHLPQLTEDLAAMKPFFRWTILTKILPYCMAPLRMEDEEAKEVGNMVIRLVYGDNAVDNDVNTPPADIVLEGDPLYGLDSDDLDTEEPEDHNDEYIEYKDV
jgi:hypothetical protein